jgi:hypothetical protein
MTDKPMDVEAIKALYRELRAFTGEDAQTHQMLTEAFMETLTPDEVRHLARLILARLLAADEGES